MKKIILLLCVIVLISSLGCAPTMTSQERRQKHVDTFSWGMSDLEKKAILNGIVLTGMHAASVRASWGDPSKVKDKIDNRRMGLNSYETRVYGPSKRVYFHSKHGYKIEGFILSGDSPSVNIKFDNHSEKLDIGPFLGISNTYLLFVNDKLDSAHGSK